MIRRFFLGLVAATLALPTFAQDAENILVIEVEGKANGIVEIELLPDLAPLHVERLKTLAREGAYDDVAFHRVIEGFMAQTGDVQNGKREIYGPRAGTGGSELPDLPIEVSEAAFERGVVGMARSQAPNSANSQFFIMFQEAPHLNGLYSVVGRVVSGMDVVDRITRGEGRGGSVPDPDYMKTVRVKADG